jgi:rhomboid family protein
MYSTDWDSSPPRGPSLALTPWVRRLLVANAVVYLLILTLFMGGGWFFDTFAFSPSRALTQPWTFVSYMFLHAGFLHLAFNMLMLFFFGSAVEQRMGSPAFIKYYLFCGLGGAALSFLIDLAFPIQPFVGASAAVFGVSLAFAVNWPNAEIMVFPIPIPIKAKWLVVGLATIDLTMAILQANSGVAHVAHLGGFLFGLMYLKGLPIMGERVSHTRQRDEEARVLVHPSAKADTEEADEPIAQVQRESQQAVLNELLDKISKDGMASLTPSERKELEEMSRQFRDK